jgi:outer membrane murein-binding lipoprotein Lpp
MFSRVMSLAAVALLAAGLAGCGIVAKINHVRHAVDTNRAAIQSLAQGLKSGEATAFSAVYISTGASPTRITYAVRPPADVEFAESGSGSGAANLDLVSNSSGEYSCTSADASSGWTCQKLGKAEAIAQNQIVDFYTPSHWVDFLETFSIAAGFAGDRVTQSSMTVNGFSMHCVDFRAKGIRGKSTICSTAQNILGYVKVAGDATSFELKSYSTSPSPSQFQLPAGAKITRAS